MPPTFRHDLFLSPFEALNPIHGPPGIVSDPFSASMTITGSGRTTRPPQALLSSVPVPAPPKKPKKKKKKKKVVVAKRSSAGVKAAIVGGGSASVITPLKLPSSSRDEEVVTINEIEVSSSSAPFSPPGTVAVISAPKPLDILCERGGKVRGYRATFSSQVFDAHSTHLPSLSLLLALLSPAVQPPPGQQHLQEHGEGACAPR